MCAINVAARKYHACYDIDGAARVAFQGKHFLVTGLLEGAEALPDEACLIVFVRVFKTPFS